MRLAQRAAKAGAKALWAYGLYPWGVTPTLPPEVQSAALFNKLLHGHPVRANYVSICADRKNRVEVGK